MEEDYETYNESVEHACAFRQLSESGSLSMLSRAESRLERTYSRALRNLLQLRHAARKQDSEKRTESQDRPPATNHQPLRNPPLPAPPSPQNFNPALQNGIFKRDPS